ncbi:MAG: TlpA family protein disulfide reductase [Alphaproteobacteria bacterium]|nr:TlpA family protein disulfide reductase [Alphaproteobacteria bacterium]
MVRRTATGGGGGCCSRNRRNLWPGQAAGRLYPGGPPRPMPDILFADAEGANVGLDAFRGRVILINLWATWCAPCVREMPALDRLQAKLGSDRFEVVAISLDRGGLAKVSPFFDKYGLKNLAIYLDPKSGAYRMLSVQRLPTSILVDASGREIGRLEAPLEWDSADAVALIQKYIDGG